MFLTVTEILLWMFVSNLNELVIFYSSWNLRAYGFLITSGKIWLIIKFFNFAYLKAIKFRGINYCGMYNSRVIKDEFLRDLFLVIRCARKILWNLFLLVGDLQDCCECFITEIRNKTNENRKKKTIFVEFIFANDHQAMFYGIFFCWSPKTTAFCGIYFCVLGTNPQKLIPR